MKTQTCKDGGWCGLSVDLVWVTCKCDMVWYGMVHISPEGMCGLVCAVV